MGGVAGTSGAVGVGTTSSNTTFGSSSKIAYGGGPATGFGLGGANAPYGGVFNNSMIPDRAGSTNPNDLVSALVGN